MLAAVSYFFAVVILTLLLMLWDWRHAIVWQSDAVALRNVATDTDKKNDHAATDDSFLKKVWYRSTGVLKTIGLLLKQVFFVKSNQHITYSELSNVPNRAYVILLNMLPMVLVMLALMSFLWLPTSPHIPVVLSVYSGMVFLISVSMIIIVSRLLSYRVFHDVQDVEEKSNDHKQQSQAKSDNHVATEVWLVISVCIVMFFAMLAAGLPANSLNLLEIMMQRTHTVSWQQGIGFLGFILASLIILHRHHDMQQMYARVRQEHEQGVKQQPIYALWQGSTFALLFVDYLLLIALSACVVVLYFGGWLPLFGIEQLLPETWLFLKLIVIIGLFLLLRKFTAPFFSMDSVYINKTNVKRTITWVFFVSLPLVLVNLLIQWVTQSGVV